ncbi:MAG: WD40-like beta Propeller containing protein, partial [Bacteroidetes bacterium]|nr:WD40-like beta Propeller containing protein [Bacteroidota bacterium]
KNENEKTKLLTLAVKAGNSAVDLLNKLPKDNTTVAANGNPNANNPNANGNPNRNDPNRNNGNANAGNPNTNNNPTVNTNTGRNNRGTIKIEGLEVTAGNAYNDNRPIPLDAQMPDGLVIRVQIGAFKNRLPNNTFKGLSPVNAETAPNGYIRYTAGNFNKLENANAVKNDLRNLGYSDAFVVVFYNGKRIPLNEALAILAKEGKTVDNNAPATAGINANTNIPKATTVLPATNVTSTEPATVTKEHEQMNGLLYTVQIGVYNKQASKRQLFGLSPIYTEKLPNGLYRYTAGIYNNTEKLITDKGRVVTTGIRDAFVSAYLNGKRIPFADGKAKQQDSTTKMEPENPIVFPSVTTPANNTPVNNTPANTTSVNNPTNPVQPFSNGVTSYPAATPENGVKPTEEGIAFKVQIGAYSKQVPNDVAAKFSSIRTWPVENKQINALYIYNIGNFTEAKFAKGLKDEAIRAGISDAFITVYKDGKKLYGADAAQYLNR